MTDAEKALREQLGLSNEFEHDPETTTLYQRLKKISRENPVTFTVATPRTAEVIDAYIWVSRDPFPEGAVLKLKATKTRQSNIDAHGLVFDSVWKTPHPGDLDGTI